MSVAVGAYRFPPIGPLRLPVGRQEQPAIPHTVAYNDSAKVRIEVPRGEDVTMTDVKAKSPSFSRRKLSAVVRKAITSYYTAEEQQEIAQAAKREGISMSSFVATASLVEARRGKRKL